MLKSRVALAVARYVGSGLIQDRQGGGTPDFAGGFIANIDRFAGCIRHVIVGPGSKLVLVAVNRPCEARARLRNNKPKRWIRDHVNPGLGRAQTFVENDRIFPALLGEPAKTVEVLKCRVWQRYVLALPCANGFRRWRDWTLPLLRSRKLVGQRAAVAE